MPKIGGMIVMVAGMEGGGCNFEKGCGLFAYS